MSKSLKGGSWVPTPLPNSWGSEPQKGTPFLLPSSLGSPLCLSFSSIPPEWLTNTPIRKQGRIIHNPKGVFSHSTKLFHWSQLWWSTPTFLKSLNFKLFRDPVEQRTPDRCGFLIVRLHLQVGTGAVAVRPIGSSWECTYSSGQCSTASVQRHCLNNFTNESKVKLKPWKKNPKKKKKKSETEVISRIIFLRFKLEKCWEIIPCFSLQSICFLLFSIDNSGDDPAEKSQWPGKMV